MKSPPELWTELSDAAALERHLGDFGEIRITRLEPESKVVWEGERASGEVEIAASGWGTQVVFTVDVAEPEPPAKVPGPLANDRPAADAVDVAEPEADAVVAEPEPPAKVPGPLANDRPAADAVDAAEPAPDGVDVAEPEPPAKVPGPVANSQPDPETPSPKVGFWARLFGRRQPVAAEPARTPEPAPDIAPVASEPEPEESAKVPGPVANAEPEPAAAEPEESAKVPGPVANETEPAGPSAEELASELLEGVLDQLGAAHHRPFSRA